MFLPKMDLVPGSNWCDIADIWPVSESKFFCRGIELIAQQNVQVCDHIYVLFIILCSVLFTDLSHGPPTT